MKQYIIPGIALLSLMLPACSEDNLEIPHKGVVSYEDFYGDPNNAENAAIFVYQTGQYAHWCGNGVNAGGSAPWIWQGAIWVMQEAPSDEIYFASGDKDDHKCGLDLNEFNVRYTYNADAPTVCYPAFYNMNRGANLLLDNYSIDMVPADAALNAKVNRAVAEAKVARAYALFNLATYWGNPPLITTQISAGTRPENTPHMETIQFCIDELEEASKYLPSKSGVNDGNMAVRYTKEFALALKGKIEVYNGLYAEGKADLKKVIDSKLYELVDGKDMHKLYHADGDASKEWLFQYNFIDDPTNSKISAFSGQYSFHFVNSTSWKNVAKPAELIATGWGSTNPSLSFAEGLIENDGMDSWRRQSWIVTYDEMINGKKIGDEVVMSFDQAIDKRGISKAGVYGNAGYWQYKRVPLKKDLLLNAQDGDNASTDVNYPIMRYAEVLLLYAEACAQTGDDGSGLAALNAVQERAGAKHKSSACTLDEVKNEKRWECFLEGSRFVDLVRWGDAKTVMGEQGKSVPSAYDDIRDTEPYKSNKEHHLRIVWNSYNEVYGFKEKKHELMPYPYTALQLNSSLKQNPGWEGWDGSYEGFEWLYNK